MNRDDEAAILDVVWNKSSPSFLSHVKSLLESIPHEQIHPSARNLILLLTIRICVLEGCKREWLEEDLLGATSSNYVPPDSVSSTGNNTQQEA